MDPQATLETLFREIYDNDEDAVVKSLAILWGWASKGGFPPKFREAFTKVRRERDRSMTDTTKITLLPGSRVLGRSLFVPLPASAQRDITWGCECEHCKARPGSPKWDTLGIDLDNASHTWVVHMPELKP